ncbi:Transposase [Filimonas lacunae]|uniref:Transposase n=1 Tax=Filimonas lacunae TaxID=477680 RepID=A0A173MIR6_9BACT|nr:IS21 family transposase [Filimonas lacunae]BAV06711.1 mobile element protein [Filimonas lacunae]BAV07380.1 mobile element protein [Filimonas lacunae]SIT34812.1 Transposase [Filimonas lacunae]
MAQKPIAMEQLKQIIQLQKDGVGIREIARRIGISRNSVRKYIALLAADTPVEESDNKTLADRAYGNDSVVHDANRLQQLITHFQYAQVELNKTGVTRQLLWQEYMVQHPDGYVYSHYCHHLNQYLKNRDLSMHLEYQVADMIMIDFAGKKQSYIDLSTGELVPCQVFVAILPFSGLIFCLAVHSQQTADFTTCINAMLMFYTGVPATILCDNLKTAVTHPSRYEPVFTDICHQLSEHYNTTFSATRPYSPRDKAMAERAVNIVYTHVYAPLRNREFTSLQALNVAMQEQLLLLNNKPYKNTPYSRWYYFEQQERSALKPLPTEPFSPKKVVTLTVQRNYHIQLSEDHHYYSVPYVHVGKKVKVLYDHRTVEVYLDHQRIALHIRKSHQKSYTTLAEHMPPHHQQMQQIKGWNREDLLAQATRIGPSTYQAAALMLENSIYIEQNYKACFGMLMLSKKYGSGRLEAACARILQGTRVNYTMIRNVLERALDKQLPLEEAPPPLTHDNIRGKEHYQ